MIFIINIIKYAAIIFFGWFLIKFFFKEIFRRIWDLFYYGFEKIKKNTNKLNKKEIKKKKNLYSDHYLNEMNTIYIGKI